MVKQYGLCTEIKKSRTNLVKAMHDSHAKRNLTKIVKVAHLVKGVKILNQLIAFQFTGFYNR